MNVNAVEVFRNERQCHTLHQCPDVTKMKNGKMFKFEVLRSHKVTVYLRSVFSQKHTLSDEMCVSDVVQQSDERYKHILFKYFLIKISMKNVSDNYILMTLLQQIKFAFCGLYRHR